VSKQRRVFGELELAVLEVVRSHEPVTVKNVQEVLGGADRYTTVMTVLSRLVEKRKLIREKQGRQYVYRLETKEDLSKGGLLGILKKQVFGGSSASMIAYLLQSSTDMSDDEIDQLQELIDNTKRKGRAK